jgi:acyl carrier protein
MLQNDGSSGGAGMSDAMTTTIRDVLRRSARLPIDPDLIADDADLFQAGMSSHASVSVMLALEDEFDIEFPDSMLKRSVFESVANIAGALAQLAVKAA